MIGALLRYGAVTAVNRYTGQPMPWGTLFVNVVGSFVLGFLLLWTDRIELGEEVRRFAAVGLLGAFTTFSALSWEVTAMLREGEWLRASAYAGASVVLGVVALAAGAASASGIVSHG